MQNNRIRMLAGLSSFAAIFASAFSGANKAPVQEASSPLENLQKLFRRRKPTSKKGSTSPAYSRRQYERRRFEQGYSVDPETREALEAARERRAKINERRAYCWRRGIEGKIIRQAWDKADVIMARAKRDNLIPTKEDRAILDAVRNLSASWMATYPLHPVDIAAVA